MRDGNKAAADYKVRPSPVRIIGWTMNIRLRVSSKRIMPMITTKRCILRRMSLEDAQDLYSVLSDGEVMKYIEPPLNMAGTLEFIKTAGLCEPPLVLAVEWRENGRVIGHAVFHPYDKSFYESAGYYTAITGAKELRMSLHSL